MEEEKYYTIILRHDDSTKWMINDPILAFGEYGVEDDTHRMKRGDGKSKWSELLYEHFGLEYLITYENLKGKVEDNEALKKALDNKVSYDIFNDIQSSLIAGINITSVDGKIGKITKTTKDISTGASKQNYLLIQSQDQSVQGFWSIDDEGVRILDLKANASIDDYTPTRKYYEDQICFYNNKLYRAITDFEAAAIFNPSQWVVLASLHSNDIKYDNKVSGLEADTVKAALDELKDLDSEKLKMTKRSDKVYGTNEDGEQFLYNKDDLRTVDSVNGIKANPTSKNIQIDASDINYDDEASETKTIKEILDSKVDKNIAGEGKKIVRDVTLTYNEENGSIELREDKLSLEDGSAETETSTIDVVAEAELAKAKSELNDKINNVNETLDNKIDATKEAVDQEIESTKSDLESLISEKENTINEKIDATKSELNSTINEKEESLQTNIDNNKKEINEKVDSIKTATDKTIADNKADIEDKLSKGLDTKIDKDISDSILVDISISTEDGEKLNEPTLKLTRKNTDTKTEVVNHIHFVEKGDIELSKENNHIVIDSTAIDKKIALNKEHLTNNDTRLNGHDASISAINEHIANHDAHFGTLDKQVAKNETDIADNKEHLSTIDTEIADIKEQHSNDINEIQTTNADQEAHLTRLDTTTDDHDKRIQANANSIIQTNKNVSSNLEKINQNKANIEANDEDIANLQSSKVDKTFADSTDGLVIGKATLLEPNSNILGTINLDSVSPKNESGSSQSILIKSTDNTLVSKALKDLEGNVVGYDLATNLDIDVNYFITTQILNTTIPSENTISFDSLTSTDKEKVELHDIISDSEGTWSRVKSIDEENQTCVTITYAKHAQAIWGTIKGKIKDQQDLKTELDKLATIEQVFTDGSWGPDYVESHLVNGIYLDEIYRNGGVQQDVDEVNNKESNSELDLWFKSRDKDGNNTSQRLITFTSPGIKINAGQWPAKQTGNVQINFKLDPEAIVIKPEDSGLTNTKLSPILRELKGLTDTNKSGIEEINNELVNINGSLAGVGQEVNNLNENKVDKILENNIVYGTDNEGTNTSYTLDSLRKVDTVNSKVADSNKNILLNAEDIPFTTKTSFETNNNVRDQLDTLIQAVDDVNNTLHRLSYAQFIWSLDGAISSEEGRTNLYVSVGDFVSATSSNNVTLIGKVLKEFSKDIITNYSNSYNLFKYLVENDYITTVGIPEQAVQELPIQ